MEISGRKDSVILKDKTMREAVTVKDCVNCTIENVDFAYDRTDSHNLTLSNCQKMKVINCKFHERRNKGLFLRVVGSRTKDTLIEGCEFWNHTFNKENGAEPLRLGNSDVSGCWFNSIVRKNSFHDLASDVETISIKSCGNVIEENDFQNNASNITLRHGGFNKIVNNRFVGKGGIRILGTGNEITNNYFKNNQDDKYYPIRIEYGNAERDPNFTSDNKPIDKAGKSHATYAQIRDGTVSGNKFENCKVTIKTESRDRKYGPVNNKMENNNVVQPGEVIDEDDKDDTTDEQSETVTVEQLKAAFDDMKATLESLKNTLEELKAAIKTESEPVIPPTSELPTQ